MRASMLFLTVVFCVPVFCGAASAQGTKDPSNPVPTMVYPIRPRDEPGTSRPVVNPNVANPNNTFPPQPPIRLRRLHPVRVPR